MMSLHSHSVVFLQEHGPLGERENFHTEFLSLSGARGVGRGARLAGCTRPIRRRRGPRRLAPRPPREQAARAACPKPCQQQGASRHPNSKPRRPSCEHNRFELRSAGNARNPVVLAIWTPSSRPQADTLCIHAEHDGYGRAKRRLTCCDVACRRGRRFSTPPGRARRARASRQSPCVSRSKSAKLKRWLLSLESRMRCQCPFLMRRSLATLRSKLGVQEGALIGQNGSQTGLEVRACRRALRAERMCRWPSSLHGKTAQVCSGAGRSTASVPS